MTRPDFPADSALWLRQSTIGSWELCPARVGFSDKEGFNKLPSEAMSWGTLVHGLLEADLSDTFEYHSPRQVAELWGDLVRDEYGIELEELASNDQIVNGSSEALGAWHLWADEVKPTLVGTTAQREIEQRLTAHVGMLPSGREVWLHGTGDLLVPELSVGYDWKTAGRGWKPSKADFIGQPNAYAFLAEQEFGYWIKLWKYWVYDRSKMRWEMHTTTRTRAQVDTWLLHVMEVAKSIDAQAFPYRQVQDTFGKQQRGWWCSAKYCGAWDICPAKYLNDGVDESEVAVTGWAG